MSQSQSSVKFYTVQSGWEPVEGRVGGHPDPAPNRLSACTSITCRAQSIEHCWLYTLLEAKLVKMAKLVLIVAICLAVLAGSDAKKKSRKGDTAITNKVLIACMPACQALYMDA